MTFDRKELIENAAADIDHDYDDVQTMLYALSVGLGRDPCDRRELAFVQEHGEALRTLPTMATVLVPDLIPADLGWDYSQVLHAEQRLQIHRPLPPAARIRVSKRIVDVFDRGPRLGALIVFEAEGRLASDDSALFTVGSTVLARGDGGFGGEPGRGPRPHRVPRRPADLSCELATRADQALLFRLNGDRNPLHSSPRTAARAGFDAPILHGLCTFGIACHAILRTICDGDETLIRALEARFSSPVVPGEVLRTDMWQEGNVVSFECTSLPAGHTVVRNGKCTLAA